MNYDPGKIMFSMEIKVPFGALMLVGFKQCIAKNAVSHPWMLIATFDSSYVSGGVYMALSTPT